MNTITLSPEVYQQVETYAQAHNLSIAEVTERAFDKLFRSSKRARAREDNPSPSGDPWWNDPRNVAIVERGLEQSRQGLSREITMEELRLKLGL